MSEILTKAELQLIDKGLALDAKLGLIPAATAKAIQLSTSAGPRKDAGLRGGQRRTWGISEADDGPDGEVTAEDRARWAEKAAASVEKFWYSNGRTIVEFRVQKSLDLVRIAFRGEDWHTPRTVTVAEARVELRKMLDAGWVKW